MPFLVDSVNAELVRQNAPIHLVLHPLFVVTRNRETGELVKVARVPSHLGFSSGDTAAMPNLSHLIAQGDNASHMESWIAVEIGLVGEDKRAELMKGIDPRARRRPRCRRRLAEDADQGPGDRRRPGQGHQPGADRRAAPGPGSAPLARRRELHLPRLPRIRPRERIRRGRAGAARGKRPRPAPRRCRHPPPVQHLTEAGRRKAREKRALVITKANSRSTVHRSAYLDYIGVKSFDAAGNVNGERRFIGLFATTRLRRFRPEHPHCPGKGGRRPRRSGLPAGLALRQGPAGHPRNLPARRALPDRNPGPRRHRQRHPAAAGTPPDPALPPARTSTAGSCPPSSTCRATATRPTSASASSRNSGRPSTP